MAKQIDDETMENVCILAKLSLTEEEKEKAKKDMQEMLDYIILRSKQDFFKFVILSTGIFSGDKCTCFCKEYITASAGNL